MILLDANILARMCNQNDPNFRRTLRVVFDFRKTEVLAVGPQSLYEFWAVATRDPSNNGLGMKLDRANRWTAKFTKMFRFLEEPSTLFSTWNHLVFTHGITGFRSHDARYVALMKTTGVDKLITYNVKHFAPFAIPLIDPSTL